MKTLIKIIKELRAENSVLKLLLEKEKARADENSKNMLYWYEKFNVKTETNV